ncbi:hypothetical protein GWI33_020009 [Rhynchophorus ferrugineus]|uniref:Uncharacterized protein n=1 Tax=Rhynchophorus ferrugineus TaxID=354439 RepID=A0A834HT79_RHYFE|nr:hypothetical protein GWI33_020009 [Rhynchophorus ferrugineus]
MSSVPKTKYMGKPFIKKIYETHKKWLGADDKPRKPEKGGDCIRRDLVSEKRGIWSNGDNKPEQNLDVETGNKLKIVISSFDKIIDEYNGVADETAKKIPPEVPPKIKKLSESFRASNLPPTKVNINNSNDIAHKKDSVLNKTSISEVIAPKSMETPLKPNTKIPKLVKAKTCSIIESKCILKKTNSSGNINANSSSPPTKTKSMTNLAFSSPTPKLIPILTDSNDVTKDTPKRKDLVINGPNNTPIKKMFTNTFTSFDSDTTPVKKDVIESPVKVKDLVKRLNSLTEPTPVEPQTPPAPLSKAVSTTNLSLSKKYGSMSKIPVNANLRKSFPSTPCHLDQIDSTGSASEGKIKTKSLNKSRSVQNLAKPKLSLPKPLQTNDKNLGKSVPDLLKSKQSSTNVSKPLAKPKNIKEDIRSTGKAANKTTKPADVKAKVNSGAKPPKPTESTKTVKNNTREKSKSILKNVKPVIDNSNKVKQVQSVDKVDGCIKNLVKKTETFNSKVVENVDPKDAFVAIRGPRDKGVNTVIKKLEGSTDTNVKPTAKVTRNQTFKKTDTGPTFGDKKAQFEPKFMEKTKFSGRTTVRRNASEKIKLDLQNTQEFLSKFESGDQHEYFLDEGGFSNSILKPISTLKSDKHLDYSSDNSDDSGNISNEVDCDETNSTGSSGRSRTSTESLPTVLDGSKRSLSKDIGLDSCEVTIKVESISNEIFFRTGVISQLEAQRDERLAGMVISLQAHCRGYLARRKLQQRKLQDLAVRCLQRNVRKFMLVREWPWWRLLVRVTPLLNVHRTEEELRAKTEELEALKQKLQKLDYERNSLKHDNDKLEAKIQHFKKREKIIISINHYALETSLQQHLNCKKVMCLDHILKLDKDFQVLISTLQSKHVAY